MPRFGEPEPLGRPHALEGFSCGVPALDRWLVEYASRAGRAGSARTYVILDAHQRRVVGYQALAAAAVGHADATERARKGMPRHPIPAVLLARLAVDRSVAGSGLGARLLEDAMTRALAASETIGARLLLAHALDERARGFYARFGCETSVADPLTMQLLTKDIRASLSGVKSGG